MNLEESKLLRCLDNFLNCPCSIINILGFTEINHWDSFTQRNMELPWSCLSWKCVILRHRSNTIVPIWNKFLHHFESNIRNHLKALQSEFTINLNIRCFIMSCVIEKQNIIYIIDNIIGVNYSNHRTTFEYRNNHSWNGWSYNVICNNRKTKHTIDAAFVKSFV